jgi:hypothetical protein
MLLGELIIYKDKIFLVATMRCPCMQSIPEINLQQSAISDSVY